jgi:aspartate aminotransferase
MSAASAPANRTCDTPDHIKAAAQAAIEAGFTKYTPAPASRSCARPSRKSSQPTTAHYKSSQIIVSVGAKHSCYNAILATCSRAMEVIIPAPYWLSYPEMVRLAGAEPIFVPDARENGWKMSATNQDAMTPRTKLVIINSPNNPTGAVYSRAELERLVEVAVDEEILMLSDEIYEKLPTMAPSTPASLLVAGRLQPDDHRKRLLESLRDDRLASRATSARRTQIAKAVDAIQSHSTSNPAVIRAEGRNAPRSRAASNPSATCARSSTCAGNTWSTGSRAWTASAWSSPKVPSTCSPISAPSV